MNLSAIKNVKSAEQRAAEEIAKRSAAHANGDFLFRKVPAPLQAAIVAKATRTQELQKPGAPAQTVAGGSLDGLASVLKAMTDGIAACTAAIRSPVQKAAPTPAPRPAATPPVTNNTALASVEKRARVAEIAGQVQKAPDRATSVLSVSGNAPYVPLETEAQRRRSRDDAVAAQRAAEQAATDRVLVSKGGAQVLALRALDASLSDNALAALSHVISRWEASQRRPVRVRASDVSDATGLTTVEAQAALDELEAARATIVAINSVGTRLIAPSHSVTGE